MLPRCLTNTTLYYYTAVIYTVNIITNEIYIKFNTKRLLYLTYFLFLKLIIITD